MREHMPHNLYAIFLCCLFLLQDLALAQTSSIARIWAIDESEKVKQEDLSNPLATDYVNNKVWDGNRVSLFGAQNEIVAFQLILESGISGTTSVDVKLNSLTNAQYTIQNDPSSAGDPYDYRGKHIEMFVESYINIPGHSSLPENWWGGAMPLPYSEFVGMMPDALIPFEAQPSKGGAPFNMGPSKNQGVWIDVYIPKNAPSGLYTGTIQVSVNNTVIKEIPIQLLVYGFTIPDENHVKNFFVGGAYSTIMGLTGKHRAGFDLTNDNYKLLEGRYFQMAHRHRFDWNINATLDQMNTHYKRYITGEYYTLSNKYNGPGIGTPHTMYSIAMYTSAFYWDGPDTQSEWEHQSDAWVNWFKQNAPTTLFFKEIRDEPPPELYDYVRERAGWINNNPGPGRELKIFEPAILDPRLFGYIGIWALVGQTGYHDTNPAYAAGGKLGYVLDTVKQRRSLGELAGIYNGTRPSYGPGFLIDTPGSEYRATLWIMWKYNVDFYFLWHTTIWGYYGDELHSRNTFQVPHYNFPGDKCGNTNPCSYGNGSLFYPGEQIDFPGTPDDKGLFGPIASIRMKEWRRGAQDYEYLWLAKQRGMDTSSIVNHIVPRAFDDYGPLPGGGSYTSQDDQPTWQKRGYAYENARLQLAQMLDGSDTLYHTPGCLDQKVLSISCYSVVVASSFFLLLVLFC